jgi:NAD-dependent deacetylase
MNKKKIVVLTGAGISAESGLKTFRDGDGLWNTYRMEDLATPEAWEANPALVLEFYNWRRKTALEAQPNAAHYMLAKLEENFDVQIITQNVDDLHERAGSRNVLHLHGELTKARSTADERLVYDIKGWQLNTGDLCEKGSQLRPHIVWFGEEVPNIAIAATIARRADIFVVIGTSLVVYPAAGLLYHVPRQIPKYLVDPKAEPQQYVENLTVIRERATTGVTELLKFLE